METPQRILLIRPSALGDVCRTVPLLASLRARFPHARIDWLVQSDFVEAIEAHPALSAAIPFPRRAVALSRLWRAGARSALFDFLRTLRAPAYDLVVDAQGLGRSGFFALITGARRRVGFANAAELGWVFLSERHHVPRSLHTVDRMLLLLERAGIPSVVDMRLYPPSAAIERAARLVPDQRFALIAPTSRWPGKRWPAERFAELACELLASNRIECIVLAGAASERDQCAPLLELASRDRRINDLIGGTSIGELMAIIARAALVVANDSAALHMAVGFDRPIVGLFGPTRIDLVGPYRRDADVIQAAPPVDSNKHKDESAGSMAMRAIPTRRVAEAALARLTPMVPAS